MALAEGDLRLRPLFDEETNESYARLTQTWSELVYRSADIVLANANAFYEFAEHDSCIYLACVEKYTAADPKADRGAGPTLETLGVLYLASAELPSTLNVGVSLVPGAHGCGYGTRAVRLAAGWALAELGCHRVQARVVRYGDAPTEDALRLFARAGFGTEGTLRRALFCAPPAAGTKPSAHATNGEWRDVTTAALLDLDWALGAPPRAVKTLWDDMFVRHQRESEDLLALEERAERRSLQRRKERELREKALAAEEEIAKEKREKREKKLKARLAARPPAQSQRVQWRDAGPSDRTLEDMVHSIISASSTGAGLAALDMNRLDAPQAPRDACPQENSTAPFQSTSAVVVDGRFPLGPWAELPRAPQSPLGSPTTPNVLIHTLPREQSEGEDIEDDDDTSSGASSYSSAAATPRSVSPFGSSDADMETDGGDDDGASTASDLSYISSARDTDTPMSEGELLSAPGTPPRSPSVASLASRASSVESWDLLEGQPATPPGTP